MKPCPGCLGEGNHDLTIEDALLGEHFSDAELETLRERGLVHPLGVLTCEECEGSGLVTDERARDLQARAVAAVDQIIARFNERRPS